tara:strand:+ start:15 stop:596 length:582 start_codon:yes stop_codon:yes gene_type:complete
MKVTNPLTIIGLFVSTTEAVSLGVLPLLDPSLQSVFIWFVMLFPIGLSLVFFSVLVLRNNVLYSPSDFKNQKHFLDMNGIKVSTEDLTEALDLATKEVDCAQGENSTNHEELSKKVIDFLSQREENKHSGEGSRVRTFFNENAGSFHTAHALGHIFQMSKHSAKILCDYLSQEGLIEKGIDPEDGSILYGKNK